MPRISPEERLYAKSRPMPNGCIEWTGGLNRPVNGYGQLSIDKRKVYVHRLALSLVEPEPEGGAVAMHSCDNPRCVNVEHLSWGTQSENMHDANRKGRGPSAERHGMAKLTAAQVAEIRARYAARRGEQQEIARDYGVNPQQISRIVTGHRWATSAAARAPVAPPSAPDEPGRRAPRSPLPEGTADDGTHVQP